MHRIFVAAATAAMCFLFPAASLLCAEPSRPDWLGSSADLAAKLAADEPPANSPARETPLTATCPTPIENCPPLPFHTVEGVSGGSVVPMAYMANAGPAGAVFGKPSAAFSYIKANHKNVETFTLTEVILRRIELGYSFSRFGLGTLNHDTRKLTGVDIGANEVYLHVWNARVMLIEETSWLPALTAGVQPKFNDGVRAIDNKLNGGLSAIGFARSNGTDYTLTATKTVIVGGRPLILNVGGRNSQAAQIGFMGFGDSCETTLEASVVYMPLDWLALGYEFRQKANPYDKVPGLIGDEDNWHIVGVGLVLKDMTLSAIWGHLGNMANSSGNSAFGFQLKYEF